MSPFDTEASNDLRFYTQHMGIIFFAKDYLPKSVKQKDFYCTVPEDAIDKM